MYKNISDISINNQYDPTRTTGLRNQFSRDMGKRFNELSRVVKVSVVGSDCFALKKIKTMQMTPAGEEEFEREDYSEEIALFLLWLQRQVDTGILTKSQYLQIGRVVSEAWTDGYIRDAYTRGILRARQEMIKAGMSVASIEASGGIEAVLASAEHAQRLKLLYASVYDKLQGVTDAMRNQIAQILTYGMIAGKTPEEIAMDLRAVIDGTNMTELQISKIIGRFVPAKLRADMIARTEIIRAFHLAAVEEYRQWGVLGIKVLGEWRTVHDGKTCSSCASMEGKVFTLNEIEFMIPAHPHCRCFVLPVIE